MEQDKATRLLLRQLRDIQAQADKIISGETSPENVENFARYSTELKQYIDQHVGNVEVRAHLADLPDIDYTPARFQIWQYLIFPSWMIDLYNDYQAKEAAIEQIKITRDKYSTLELLIRAMA